MKWVVLLLLACLVIMGFTARTDDTLVVPFPWGVAAGWLVNAPSGAMAGSFTVNKFGHNQDSDTTRDTVWDGSDFGGPIRCFNVLGTTAAAVYLSSDDENDASDNNGISVTVEYLDAQWNMQTLVVALGAAVASGTTSVQISTGNILRINRMFPTSTAVAGNVYASTDADAGSDGVPDTILTQLVAVIDLVEQQTMQACYTVPNNFNALLTAFCVDNITTAAGAVATFRLQAATNGGSSRTQSVAHISEGVHFCHESTLPILFVEKTDVEMTNVSDKNNASTAGTFDLLMFPNRT